MRRISLFLSALAILSLCALTPATSPAQTPPVPRIFGNFTPTQGAWAEYAVVEKAGGAEAKMRMSIVGEEDGAWWYEVRNETGGSVNIVKMLVTGDPNETTENIKRMIIKSGDSPAMEMNRDFVVMGRQMATHMFEKRSGVDAAKEAEVTLEKVGGREVTVPAGTFKAVQYRIKEAGGGELGTYDVAENVPPFGFVFSETRTSTMKLLAYGKDAVSAVTEEPVPMMTPPGMPQGMPRGVPPGMPRNPSRMP